MAVASHSVSLAARKIPALEILAICFGNALGSLDTAIQPLWVDAFLKNGLLAATGVGWLGSGELLLIGCSTFALSAIGLRANVRQVAIAAAVLVTAANLIASIPTLSTLIIGRLLSGLGTGSLLAVIIGLAARREGAQRVLSLMQIGVLLMISMIYFVSPILMSHYGPGGLFALISGIGIVTSLVCLAGLPYAPPPVSGQAVDHKEWRWMAPLLGCLGMVSVAAGMTTVGTFIITIGTGLGFSGRTMANVLAVAIPSAILGPVLAHWLGERAGLLRPLLLGLVVIAAGFFLEISAPSPALMCAYLAVQGMAAFLYVSYAMALVGRLDTSGHFASATPAFIMIGGAVGPKLGSELIGFGSFHTLAAVGASCVAAGALLFSAAGTWRGATKAERSRNPP